MINGETIKFLLMVDSLCQLSAGGFTPVQELEDGDPVRECVYYDEDDFDVDNFENITVYKAYCVAVDEKGCYVEEDSCLYNEFIDTDSEYDVSIIFSDEEPYIQVTLDEDDVFIIRDGVIISA